MAGIRPLSAGAITFAAPNAVILAAPGCDHFGCPQSGLIRRPLTVKQDRAPYDVDIVLAHKAMKSDEWIEIELVDEDDNPVAYEIFVLTLPNGRKINGMFDGDGRYRCYDIDSPGDCTVEFPNLDKGR